jgi:FkbM family methyltransferase
MGAADCGAHHGCFTVALAKAVGPSGRVSAWEALPENARIVAKNLDLNGCRHASVRAVGVGDVHTKVRISPLLGNSILQWGDERADASVEIEVAPLDDELQHPIDLLKLDVEGSDLRALKGAARTLRSRPILDLELHNFLFEDRRGTLEEIVGMLSQLAYDFTLLGEIRSETKFLGPTLTVEDLIGFDNPHLFCIPR